MVIKNANTPCAINSTKIFVYRLNVFKEFIVFKIQKKTLKKTECERECKFQLIRS